MAGRRRGGTGPAVIQWRVCGRIEPECDPTASRDLSDGHFEDCAAGDPHLLPGHPRRRLEAASVLALQLQRRGPYDSVPAQLRDWEDQNGWHLYLRQLYVSTATQMYMWQAVVDYFTDNFAVVPSEDGARLWQTTFDAAPYMSKVGGLRMPFSLNGSVQEMRQRGQAPRVRLVRGQRLSSPRYYGPLCRILPSGAVDVSEKGLSSLHNRVWLMHMCTVRVPGTEETPGVALGDKRTPENMHNVERKQLEERVGSAQTTRIIRRISDKTGIEDGPAMQQLLATVNLVDEMYEYMPGKAPTFGKLLRCTKPTTGSGRCARRSLRSCPSCSTKATSMPQSRAPRSFSTRQKANQRRSTSSCGGRRPAGASIVWSTHPIRLSPPTYRLAQGETCRESRAGIRTGTTRRSSRLAERGAARLPSAVSISRQSPTGEARGPITPGNRAPAQTGVVSAVLLTGDICSSCAISSTREERSEEMPADCGAAKPSLCSRARSGLTKNWDPRTPTTRISGLLVKSKTKEVNLSLLT